MSSHRARRVDRRAAEQLLAGARSADAEPLTSILRTAAAPAHPKELDGEPAALAAFRAAAALDPAPEHRRPSKLRSALTRLLTVKAVLALALVGSTGVVLAARGGAVPVPWSDKPAEPPAVTRSHAPVTTTTRPSDTGRPGDQGNAPAPSELPGLAGLCQAYLAQVNQSPGKATDNPAFTALVTAAGGAENVPEFCADLAAEQPRGRPSDLPTPTSPGNSDDQPGSRPATPPSRAQSPVSPAPGTTTAVSPSGARTPSRGG